MYDMATLTMILLFAAVYNSELLQVQKSDAGFTTDQHTTVNSNDKQRKKKRKHELLRWLQSLSLVLWCQQLKRMFHRFNNSDMYC